MFLATQYYRPPFPERRFRAEDLSRIRDAGLHGVQLWCVWGWIEAEPGVYRYDDYDELTALAAKRGLKVVLSTIAEIHPFWIHRLVPGSEMVDHMGRKVVSSCRSETNVGLTPGGCFDHPRVAELMGRFLTDIAARYAGAGSLIGWDCWNETRWCVQADGHVCYCPHTLGAFRDWLDKRHGGLEGLSAAWRRRYFSWQDVYAGKLPGRPFTEMIEFLRFLAWRAARHAAFRYEAIRRGDPRHLISAHCGQPAIQSAGRGEQPLVRGVDWDLADALDGFGCSHFPLWDAGFDEAGLGVRLESTRSANRGKVMWVSELQGGSARSGFDGQRSVDPVAQQRWIAGGMARGAKGVIFWCWRDEVFGRESSGFGLAGADGLAEERLAAMRRMRSFIDRNDRLIEAYTVDPPEVGVLFVPDNYMLRWAGSGDASEAVQSVNAYAAALERLAIPYEFVEARHPEVIDRLSVLLMPWCMVLPRATRPAILRLLRRGGRILTEAETDSFDEQGFYRCPGDRPLMRALGVADLGRRALPEEPEHRGLLAEVGGGSIELMLDKYVTPLGVGRTAEVLAADEHGQPLLVRRRLGKGAAYVLGGFLGPAYFKERNEGLEALIRQVCQDAGVRARFALADDAGRTDGLQWRSGTAGRYRLLWIVNASEARLVTATGDFGRATKADELTRGASVPIRRQGAAGRCALELEEGGFAVLRWRGHS